jgi:hypothetical protein
MNSVLLASVLTHFDLTAARQYLKEVHRTIAADGIVLATALFADNAPHDDGITFFFDREEFLATVEGCGFSWRAQENRRPGSLQNWFVLRKS